MDRIFRTLGLAQILGITRRGEGVIGWERRTDYLGFEGQLVIRLTDDGRYYACIENGRRCISTSCGELTLTDEGAVFETRNSTYKFRLVRQSQSA
ncbi:MAG: hypothetical protein IKN17_04240 [Ruminococcus sp.]|nr:hypothetical protein [Ruminococcus sp.]